MRERRRKTTLGEIDADTAFGRGFHDDFVGEQREVVLENGLRHAGHVHDVSIADREVLGVKIRERLGGEQREHQGAVAGDRRHRLEVDQQRTRRDEQRHRRAAHVERPCGVLHHVLRDVAAHCDPRRGGARRQNAEREQTRVEAVLAKH